VNVRPLLFSDLDALLALYTHLHVHDLPRPHRSVVEETWHTALANPMIRYFGGFDDNTLVSSCTITVIPNLTRGCRPYGLIENVVTHEAHRGKGWGKRLLRETLDFAWSRNCYKVLLLTGRKDEATLNFYDSAGFDRNGKTGFVASPS
jgi:GNAT superfamily N-acetyltransferase